MIFNISEVAVCCSNASSRSWVSRATTRPAMEAPRLRKGFGGIAAF
jgi:hypothetical protein